MNTFRGALSFVMLLAGSPSAAGTAPVQAVQAVRAADFENAVGVNVHSAVSKDRFETLLRDIEFLNIHHLRDGIRPLQCGDVNLKLALTSAAGIDWDVIIPSAPAPFLTWLGAHHADIGSIEGPNEPNLEGLRFNGLVGTPAAAQLQHEIYRVVKSNPALAGITLLNYSMGYYGDPARPINLAPDFNAQNLHIYPGQNQPPSHEISTFIRLAHGWSAAPIIVSEIGFATIDMSCRRSVSRSVQAVDLLDSLLDDAALGVSRTYLYDLVDDGADPGGCDAESHYGLFNPNGSPKPAALALHHFMAILADTSSTAPRFNLGSLSFSINPAISSLLVQKSAGAFYLLLWQETPWPPRDGTVVVSVNSPARFTVFDPVQSESGIPSNATATSVAMVIGEDPMILEIDRGGLSSPDTK